MARWALSGIVFVICLVMVPLFWVALDRLEAQLHGNAVLSPVPYNEATKAAVSQKLDGAKGLFQITLLVMAVLWGAVIAKPGEERLVIRRETYPEVLMFVVVNVLFVHSGYGYTRYTDAMAEIHKQGAVELEDSSAPTIMDYGDDRINDLYRWQRWLWIGAMLAAAFTLVTLYALKQNVGEENSCAAPTHLPSPLPSQL